MNILLTGNKQRAREAEQDATLQGVRCYREATALKLMFSKYNLGQTLCYLTFLRLMHGFVSQPMLRANLPPRNRPQVHTITVVPTQPWNPQLQKWTPLQPPGPPPRHLLHRWCPTPRLRRSSRWPCGEASRHLLHEAPWREQSGPKKQGKELLERLQS